MFSIVLLVAMAVPPQSTLPPLPQQAEQPVVQPVQPAVKPVVSAPVPVATTQYVYETRLVRQGRRWVSQRVLVPANTSQSTGSVNRPVTSTPVEFPAYLFGNGCPNGNCPNVRR